VEYLFDTVSAFGTVGLSMGITPKLNDVQKYALYFDDVCRQGRPLTLAFRSPGRRVKRPLNYAEEGIMVG